MTVSYITVPSKIAVFDDDEVVEIDLCQMNGCYSRNVLPGIIASMDYAAGMSEMVVSMSSVGKLDIDGDNLARTQLAGCIRHVSFKCDESLNKKSYSDIHDVYDLVNIACEINWLFENYPSMGTTAFYTHINELTTRVSEL